MNNALYYLVMGLYFATMIVAGYWGLARAPRSTCSQDAAWDRKMSGPRS